MNKELIKQVREGKASIAYNVDILTAIRDLNSIVKETGIIMGFTLGGLWDFYWIEGGMLQFSDTNPTGLTPIPLDDFFKEEEGWILTSEQKPKEGDNVECSDDGKTVSHTADYKTDRTCMMAGIAGGSGYFSELGFATDGENGCDKNLILDDPKYWRYAPPTTEQPSLPKGVEDFNCQHFDSGGGNKCLTQCTDCRPSPSLPEGKAKIADFYPGKEYQRLFNAIDSINGTPLVGEMQNIISIVHEYFPAPDHVPDTGNMMESLHRQFESETGYKYMVAQDSNYSLWLEKKVLYKEATGSEGKG